MNSNSHELSNSGARKNNLIAAHHHAVNKEEPRKIVQIPRSMTFFNQSANAPYWMNASAINYSGEMEMYDADGAEEAPLEQDEILQALSKWNSRRSKRNMQSLKFLTFQAIAANATLNLLGDLDAPQLPLHTMSSTLKSKFVEHLLLTSQRVNAEIAKQLLHSETTTFNMGIVEKGMQQRETWKFMVANCPLMESIIWRDLNGVPFVNFPIDDLLKMPNVVHIEMPDFWCNDETIEILTQNFKNLRVLHVSLAEISENAEDMILQLTELRSFDFHGSKLQVTKLQRDVKFMAKLLCGLPKLKELWPTFPVRCQHSMALNWLLENDIRVPISLKKLRLDGETPYPLDLVQRVEILYLMGSMSNYGTLLCRTINFPHLRALNLQMSSLDRKFLRHLLVLYGEQLEELKIEIKQENYHDDALLDLFDVISLCPRLITFHVIGNVACIDLNNNCSFAHFHSLENVKIKIYGEFRSNFVNCMMLHSPKLKTLKLGPMVKFLDHNFVYHLVMKVEQGDLECFCNLEELWLSFQHIEMSEHLMHVLKFTLCSAPKIKKFVLEVMSNPNMRAQYPYYGQLAAFCERYMPDVEFIQI